MFIVSPSAQWAVGLSILKGLRNLAAGKGINHSSGGLSMSDEFLLVLLCSQVSSKSSMSGVTSDDVEGRCGMRQDASVSAFTGLILLSKHS